MVHEADKERAWEERGTLDSEGKQPDSLSSTLHILRLHSFDRIEDPNLRSRYGRVLEIRGTREK